MQSLTPEASKLSSWIGALARNARGAKAATTSVKSNGIFSGFISYTLAMRGIYRSLDQPFRLPPKYFGKLVNPQLDTKAWMRVSKAAVNIELWPPSEWPMQ